MISGSNRNNIKFVAVARTVDRVMVASYVHQKGDHNLAQYNNAVQEVLSAPDFVQKVTPGSRYRLVGEVNSFNFTVDGNGRVYIVITVTDYPERLAFAMINELIPQFSKDLGSRADTCAENGLKGASKKIFSALADEYDDPSNKDKISRVRDQVEDVKSIMHNNIQGMLHNLDDASKIDQDAQVLQEQAAKFQQQAKTIKRREQWKNWKLTLVIVAVVVLVLIVIIVSTTQT